MGVWSLKSGKWFIRTYAVIAAICAILILVAVPNAKTSTADNAAGEGDRLVQFDEKPVSIKQ